MASSIKWLANQVAREFRRRVFLPRVRKAGDQLLVAVRLNIGQQGPPHSRPGEYPRRITGYLTRAVNVEVDEQTLKARVYVATSEAPYALKIEKIRPFLSRTLDEMRPSIRRSLSTGFREFK